MEFFVINAFTDKPFSGNPAAVFILEDPIADQLMQKIASEINLSESAFLTNMKDGYKLRWFTPTIEVDLCGHATLASAHVLWSNGKLAENREAKFYTKSGFLSARKNGKLIEMDFPREEVKEVDCPQEILEALKLVPIFVGKSGSDYLVEADCEETVRSLNPNLEFISNLDSRGLIITSISNSSEYDFVSRFFAPQSGINEDPVTGSTHCALGTYWSNKLRKKSLVGFQASRRGGTVYVEVKEDKILLSGSAVTVIESKLFI